MAPVAQRDMHTPAPKRASPEPANRDVLSPGLTSADIAQGGEALRQVDPQTGEPKLENLDGDLVG
ncbi:hypothetical protein P0D88_01755 [Paraburkholderia sp. RL18-103-BIB-C]|uniref:hypothetical protein n=1 Tax=Paraburkholderia sp. RL18-103-BIB-C TaxID=3031637 RepID=UPI0038BAA8BE